MKIILTGTGASQNIPAFRCRCEICSQARKTGQKKYFRNNSCAVVMLSDGENILIDAPPQFMNQIEKYGINDLDINHLLLSHRHDDHLLGLFHMLSVKKSKSAVVDKSLDIYHGRVTGEYMHSKFNSLSDPSRFKQLEGVLKLKEINELQSFNIGSCTVVPLETNHLKVKSADPDTCIEETFGFCFSSDGANLYYLVDAAEKLHERTIDFMRENKPDCIVIDCTYAEGKISSGHGDVESVLNLRSQFPDGRMIISHISHKNYTPDLLEELLFPAGIEVGYDGMKIVL